MHPNEPFVFVERKRRWVFRVVGSGVWWAIFWRFCDPDHTPPTTKRARHSPLALSFSYLLVLMALVECDSMQRSVAVNLENPIIPYLSSPGTSTEDGNKELGLTTMPATNGSRSGSSSDGKTGIRKGSLKHRQCDFCHATQTPMWRRGPGGKGTLCNACGVKWSLRRRSTPKRVISLQNLVLFPYVILNATCWIRSFILSLSCQLVFCFLFSFNRQCENSLAQILFLVF